MIVWTQDSRTQRREDPTAHPYDHRHSSHRTSRALGAALDARTPNITINPSSAHETETQTRIAK